MSHPSYPRGVGRTRRALGRLVLVLDLAIVGYLGAYAAVRASRMIVHTSNYRHWHPEKRSPEHHVGHDAGALSSFFKPLRVLEEKYHSLRG